MRKQKNLFLTAATTLLWLRKKGICAIMMSYLRKLRKNEKSMTLFIRGGAKIPVGRLEE